MLKVIGKHSFLIPAERIDVDNHRLLKVALNDRRPEVKLSSNMSFLQKVPERAVAIGAAPGSVRFSVDRSCFCGLFRQIIVLSHYGLPLNSPLRHAFARPAWLRFL